MPDLETIFVSTITALLSGVTVAYFTNKFSASRSTEEKIWELRRASYGRILRDAASITLDVSNAYNRRTGTHLESARKAYTDSYLILSNRFIDLFEEFLLSFDNVDDLSPSEGHKIISAAIRAGRPKLLQQARSEMPRRTRWPALL
jgi:hypothetical protein